MRREERVEIGQWPTPVASLERLRSGLWMKDDGACHPAYGGNKVRKLEYLLAGAGEEVATLGAVGSHHVLATAIHGRRLGHRVKAVLLARPWSTHAEKVLAATIPLAELHFRADVGEAVALFQSWAAAGTTTIPAGGSSEIGAKGWIRAGWELAEQVRAGLLPEPRRVFLPLGTAATAAGLATGLREAGLSSRVIGVRVVPEMVTSAERVASLGGPVDIDNRWLGEGYGVETAEGRAAVEAAATVGLVLEATYTGKALAAALAAEGEADLWWNTVSTVAMPDGVAVGDPAPWGWAEQGPQGRQSGQSS